MTGADASSHPPARVRVLVTEPVRQDLDGGRQTVETRDGVTTPGKAVLGDAVAGNAGLSCGPPFDPLDVPPAPADQLLSEEMAAAIRRLSQGQFVSYADIFDNLNLEGDDG